MKPCLCDHAKNRHTAWGSVRPGPCQFPGCPCKGYVNLDQKQKTLEGA